MIKLAIIGVSGRNPLDKKRLEKKHMEYVDSTVRSYITNVLNKKPSDVILVSGGSSWMDHVAVQLFLTKEFGGLELYLPSRFDHKQKQYINTHEGRTLNGLHRECAQVTGYDVLMDLTRAVTTKGVKIQIKRGFKQRNTLVAKNCDHLLAFTFDPDGPIEGGTLHTWTKTPHLNKLHFDLSVV